MYTDATHFAHRESSGYVIDLYWDPANAWHQFRVQVLERGSGNGFVLFPTTGRLVAESRVFGYTVRSVDHGEPGGRTSHLVR